MRLLLLGGPRFLGRAVLGEALTRGHAVSTFNRSGTDTDTWVGVESLRGDRDGGLDVLAGRTWDAVIDTSGYVPRVVGASADRLRDAAGHYVFVSSISVYASFAEVVGETAPVAQLAEPRSEDVQADYGALKARCEERVEAAFPGRATHVRAGLIVGPFDPTGRFTYWPHRVARGGEVLVPAPLSRRVQLVDVRDLATWMVDCAERRTAGVFNATCTHAFAEVLATAQTVSGADASFTAVDPEFLVEHEVGEWMELPLWIADRQDDWRHFMDVDASRAAAAGLTARSLQETVRGALEEASTVDGVGLAPERERELLAAWHARTRA
jgi:2'-hydroxyisoflavone reductase